VPRSSQRWCNDEKATPPSAPAFAEEFKAISQQAGLRTKQDGTKIYALM
jgi:hypothetical protein